MPVSSFSVPGQLFVVRFEAAENSGAPVVSLVEVFEDPGLDVDLHDATLVVLSARNHASRYRKIFHSPPGPAVWVQTAQGVVLAAAPAPLSVLQVRGLLRDARAGRPAVETATARVAGARTGGTARSAARFELAEAYLRSGNPFGAYDCYTLVTFGRDRELVRRACKRLARLEVDRGNAREAREWLSHLRDPGVVDAVVRRSGSEDADLRLTEALIAIREARPGQAATALREVVNCSPDSAAGRRASTELEALEATTGRRD